MPNPAASPTVSSTVGLKNMVIAPLTVDTEETLTYSREKPCPRIAFQFCLL